MVGNMYISLVNKITLETIIMIFMIEFFIFILSLAWKKNILDIKYFTY